VLQSIGRILICGLLLLSWVGLIATSVLWTSSYQSSAWVRSEDDSSSASTVTCTNAWLSRGQFAFSRQQIAPVGPPPADWAPQSSPPGSLWFDVEYLPAPLGRTDIPECLDGAWGGFNFIRGVRREPWDARHANTKWWATSLPLWAPAVLFAALPVGLAWRRLRRVGRWGTTRVVRSLVRRIIAALAAAVAILFVASAAAWVTGRFLTARFTVVAQHGATTDGGSVGTSFAGLYVYLYADRVTVSHRRLDGPLDPPWYTRSAVVQARTTSGRRSAPDLTPVPGGPTLQFAGLTATFRRDTQSIIPGVSTLRPGERPSPLPPVTTVTREFLIPYWLLLLVTATLPALWLRSALRRRRGARRLAAGQCTHCGYDLRSSPDRCPECGRPAPAHRPAGDAALESLPESPAVTTSHINTTSP